MVLALIKTAQQAPTVMESLKDYPEWFVVACVTIVVAVAIWVLVKLLKWALWALLIGVLAVGGVTVAWLLLQ
jgi:cytochrome c-type biogenesis protein CcmH/NrfG